jgi:hypothetical protein
MAPKLGTDLDEHGTLQTQQPVRNPLQQQRDHRIEVFPGKEGALHHIALSSVLAYAVHPAVVDRAP